MGYIDIRFDATARPGRTDITVEVTDCCHGAKMFSVGLEILGDYRLVHTIEEQGRTKIAICT